MNTPDRNDPGSQERGTPLEQAWHLASNEQPPPRLDAAILAAAHEAVRDRVAQPEVVRRRSRSWLARWQPVAAAAAVTGIAFVLVQLLPHDRDAAPSMQVEAPAVDASQEVLAQPPAEARSQGPATPARSTHAPDPERRGQAMPAPAVVAAPTDVPAPTVVPAPAVAPAAVLNRSSAESVARKETAADGAEGAKRDAAAAESVSAAEWAARVAALYESGDGVQAAAELRVFRAAYPDADAYLAESLRDWARTIK
jgi:Meckel syndrome type 1 protein